MRLSPSKSGPANSTDALRQRLDERVKTEERIQFDRVRAALGANFSTAVFARWLGRHRNQPLEWIKSGDLRAAHVGRRFVIAAEDAARFLANAYVSADARRLQ